MREPRRGRAGTPPALLATLLVSGCAGVPDSSASADDPALPSPATRAATGAARTGALAAEALAPGMPREAILAALAGIDGTEPACESAKVAGAGTGRAFLHERCRRDWAAPSPVRYAGADADEGGALLMAHVDLVGGTAVRVDLLVESPTGTREIVAIDPRLGAVMPTLAAAAPPPPAGPAAGG